jgi:periplasmic protein CpxP/Spy
MTTFNPVRKSILIGLAVLGMASASVAVQAQAPAAEGRHGHALTQEQRQAKWSEHMAKREAKLHDALKLSAAQEPAWRTFIAAAKPAARPARGEHGAWKDLPAPQRMEKAIEMSKRHTHRDDGRTPGRAEDLLRRAHARAAEAVRRQRHARRPPRAARQAHDARLMPFI